MNKAEEIGSVIRRVLVKYGQRARDSDVEVAVALSGGVDSCAVLAGLLEGGCRPVVVSYTPMTHQSTDFLMAQNTANNMGLRFVPVLVDTRFDNMNQLARLVIANGYHSKVEVESLAPMVAIAEATPTGYLFTGDQSDGYFALSKWAAHNYDRSIGVPKGSRSRTVKHDTSPDRIDAIRKRYYEDDLSCSGGVASICKGWSVKALFPFREPEIREAFTGSLWTEVNEPRIKEPVRAAFPEYFDPSRIQVRPVQVNLHKGDSLFGDTMSRVMMEGHPGFASVRGLYSAIARCEA
jgi:hypothetical protein